MISTVTSTIRRKHKNRHRQRNQQEDSTDESSVGLPLEEPPTVMSRDIPKAQSFVPQESLPGVEYYNSRTSSSSSNSSFSPPKAAFHLLERRKSTGTSVPVDSIGTESANAVGSGRRSSVGGSSANQYQTSLEDRVRELETKLATLSLLLQQQRRQNRSVSPNSSPPPSPPTQDTTSGLTPALDSPAPYRKVPHKRNLSFRLLYQDSNDHDQGSSSNTNTKSSTKNNDNTNNDDNNSIKQQIFLPLSDDIIAANNNGKNKTYVSTKKARELQRESSTSTASTVITDHISPSARAEQTTKESPSLKSQESTNGDDQVKTKWLDYLNSFQESTHDVDQQMEEFVKVPSAVEGLLSFGFWICVDSFLYVLTVLPIRFSWSCVLLVRYIAYRLWKGHIPEGPYRFHRRHVYQLIQIGIIFIVYRYVLLPISIGKLYHWIRGQSMIKLYVLIAIVEVFDRMMCSLGQDCLDSLYWNTTRRPRSFRMAISVTVVIVYATVHSLLLFCHVATLNVAMNSADQALLSLLVSGNFAEIKSTVFKKYNKPNLFKIAASDICERFKLALFLGLVLILNLSQGMDRAMVMQYVQMCGIVWCAEWLADWIKHSFITKFNYISSSVYPEYALLLAGDVTGFGHEGVNLDHSHAVVKRIGLAQIPLVCVMARFVREAAKYASYDYFNSESTPVWMLAVGGIVFWLLLLLTKIALGSFLQRISHAKLKAAPELSESKSSPTKKKKN